MKKSPIQAAIEVALPHTEEETNNQTIQVEPYAESNRKTRAFYFTVITCVFLFVGSHWWKDSPTETINSIIQLAMVYIAGLAVNDSIRYHKFGSKTMGDPEKMKELQDRYGDK